MTKKHEANYEANQFVIFNPWEVPRNWIVFYQIFFVISPGCYISWLDATLDDLQTRPLHQILLFLRSNSLTVKKLQTKTVKHSDWIEYEKSWKYLFHLLQALQGIILKLFCQITIRLCEAMTFCGTFCKNVARTKI